MLLFYEQEKKIGLRTLYLNSNEKSNKLRECNDNATCIYKYNQVWMSFNYEATTNCDDTMWI